MDSAYVALKAYSLSIYCMTYRSFRRSRIYSRSIWGYTAIHSDSLCPRTGSGGAITTDWPGRGAKKGTIIVAYTESCYEIGQGTFPAGLVGADMRVETRGKLADKCVTVME